MKPQYESYISQLSTEKLISILEKTQYSNLDGVLRSFNITGKDLIELREFNVRIKLGNNVHRNKFLALLNHVQTEPQELFPLKPALKPKTFAVGSITKPGLLKASNHSVTSSRPDTLANEKQKLKPSELSSKLGNNEANSLENQLKSATTKLKPVLIKKPITLPNADTTNLLQNNQTSNAPFETQKYRRFSTTALNQDPKPDDLPEYVNAIISSLPRNMRGSIKTQEQYIKARNSQIQDISNLHEVEQSSETIGPETTKPEQFEGNFDELAEYINTTPNQIDVTTEKRNNSNKVKIEEELPEYSNTHSIACANKPHIQENKDTAKIPHILDNPRARQQLEDKLKHALKEMQRKANDEDEIYSEPSNELADDFTDAELTTSNTPDSLDSFDETPPNDELPEPPPLPVRPPAIFKTGVVKRIKQRDSANSDSSSVAGNNSEPVEIQNTYGKLPKVNLKPPSITFPEDASLPPDDNQYEIPVTLNSPEYALKRIKFFRDVTREEGNQILGDKPVGTFLLRPSKTHLAVLMFRGARMINNVPICHDNATNDYFLASRPGTQNVIRFKTMNKLLDFYADNSLFENGLNNERLLNFDINNIN